MICYTYTFVKFSSLKYIFWKIIIVSNAVTSVFHFITSNNFQTIYLWWRRMAPIFGRFQAEEYLCE